MSLESSLNEISKLQAEADSYARRKHYDQAAKLLDKAINLGMAINLDMFTAKILREVFLSQNGADRNTEIIEQYQQAILTYQARNNRVELLETLINLTQFLINRSDMASASNYLNQAEVLITSMSMDESQIRENLPLGYPLSVNEFLQVRSATLIRLREQL